jgi:beta-1,4-mannosyl-glycoprotein beta-1,4-N-acetylglucosaminyltransferase
MKIIDCFMFYNELDILKIRLEEIYDLVDYVIIVEATVTHNNGAKPLYFQENKHLFEKYKEKIIHLVTDFQENYPFSRHIKANNGNWFRENYQRECIQTVITKMHLHDNDIIITTDCDEIPKHSIIQSIRDGTLKIDDGVYSLEMVLYYYNIELTTPRKWYHAKLLNYKTYKTFPLITNIRFAPYSLIPDAGFHLSYFGDVNFIKTKVESFAESVEYSTQGKDIQHLTNCYNNNILHFNNEKLIYVPLVTNDNVPVHFKPTQ